MQKFIESSPHSCEIGGARRKQSGASHEERHQEELAQRLEARAQRDLPFILGGGLIYDSAEKQWLWLADLPAERKAAVSLPSLADQYRQRPPDIITFVELESGIVVASSDVKLSVNKARQITRGRVFKAWRNPGFGKICVRLMFVKAMLTW